MKLHDKCSEGCWQSGDVWLLLKKQMRPMGQPGGMVTRSYFRFRPTRALKRDLVARIRSGEFVE